MKDSKQVPLSTEGQKIMEKFGTPLNHPFPYIPNDWKIENEIIRKIADRYVARETALIEEAIEATRKWVINYYTYEKPTPASVLAAVDAKERASDD